ncbi:hypothetical protein [Asticcacaulis solisilvae]|uniref:hypothetical protein n=1 Tax=Asticcacaulis solisilvae TaxID=1217274 RepID=UPI003FD7B209
MEFECRTAWCSNDCWTAVKQMDQAFGETFARLAQSRVAAISGFGSLIIFLSIRSPAFTTASGNQRGSYHKASDTYYATGTLNYDDWVSRKWVERVDSYARSVADSIRRIAKSRITKEERELLLEIVALTIGEVSDDVPSDVLPLDSIFVKRDASGRIVGMGSLLASDADLAMGYSVEEFMPGEPLPERDMSEDLPAFKLYRRDDDSLHYHEAWASAGEITEHWGLCGTEGESRVHAYATPAEARRICAALKAKARAEDYRPVAPSRHRRLVVELPVDGFGDVADLDTRHEIEDYLNDRLGWLGLGHCDGGSTGSGTMEVFCFVVDMAIARDAIARDLAALSLPVVPRIYEMT